MNTYNYQKKKEKKKRITRSDVHACLSHRTIHMGSWLDVLMWAQLASHSILLSFSMVLFGRKKTID
jgi:hypothetical protein